MVGDKGSLLQGIKRHKCIQHQTLQGFPIVYDPGNHFQRIASYIKIQYIFTTKQHQ
jgi:hypothetical protein